MSTLQSIGVVLIYPSNIPQPIPLWPFLSFIKWFLAHAHTYVYFGFPLLDITSADFGHSSLRHMWELVRVREIAINPNSRAVARHVAKRKSKSRHVGGRFFSFRCDCDHGFLPESLDGDGRSHEGKRDARWTNTRARRTSGIGYINPQLLLTQ